MVHLKVTIRNGEMRGADGIEIEVPNGSKIVPKYGYQQPCRINPKTNGIARSRSKKIPSLFAEQAVMSRGDSVSTEIS